MKASAAAERLEAWQRELQKHFERSQLAYDALREAESFRDEACEQTRAFWEYQVGDRRDAVRLAEAEIRRFKETRPTDVFDLLWPFNG